MRLYTIQPKEVWKQIQNENVFICDKSKSYYLDGKDKTNINFVKGYQWLAKQMTDRIGNPDNIEYPVWAWYKRNDFNEYPNLNDLGFGEKEPLLVIELEIPKNQVLLSDFEEWHCVLNDDFCWDCSKSDFDNDIWIPTNPDKEKSWEHIFEISNSSFVQATFWKVTKDMVVSVEEFIPNNIDLEFEVHEILTSEHYSKDMLLEDFLFPPEIWAQNYIKNEIRTKQIHLGMKNYVNDKYIEHNTIEKCEKKTPVKCSDRTIQNINIILGLFHIVFRYDEF